MLDNTSYLTSERGYEPNWRRYRYSPDRARGLLRQAGCSRGSDGVYSCAGERLRLRFLTTAGVPIRERTLELVQTQLRRVGIEAQPVFAPTSYSSERSFPPATSTSLSSGSASRRPGDVSFSACGEDEPHGYCSRLLTADVNQFNRIVLPARRVVVANRIDRRLAAAVPILPLFQGSLVYVVRKPLQGVVPNGFGILTTGGTLWNAENWWLAP